MKGMDRHPQILVTERRHIYGYTVTLIAPSLSVIIIRLNLERIVRTRTA
jgi:hypothetical protein